MEMFWVKRIGCTVVLNLKQQNADSYPITDKVTRFWIILDEGVNFVLDTFNKNEGEIFVPKIPSVNILDVLEAVEKGANYIAELDQVKNFTKSCVHLIIS